MAKIAINSAGSLGDLNPLTLLAVELKARGHDIVFISLESYRQRIEAFGLHFEPTRPDLSPDDAALARKIMDPENGIQFLLKEICIPNLRANYEDVSKASSGADLIISGSLAFVVYLVHQKQKLPWISVALQPGLFMSTYEFPIIAHLPGLARFTSRSVWFNRLFLRGVRYLLDSWSRQWLSLCDELQVPRANVVLDAQFSPHLQLAAYSPVFSGKQPDWPTHRKHVGFLQPKPEEHTLSTGTERYLNSGVSPIIFTLGSTAVLIGEPFFDIALTFAKETGQRTMLVCGNLAPQFRERAMAHPHIHVSDREPYSALFPRGRAIIHQGGVGTTGETLRAGVPSLLVPFGADQYDNGHHVIRMGCGKSVPMKHFNLENLKSALSNILTENVIARAKEVSKILLKENGIKTAANEVENFLKNL